MPRGASAGTSRTAQPQGCRQDALEVAARVVNPPQNRRVDFQDVGLGPQRPEVEPLGRLIDYRAALHHVLVRREAALRGEAAAELAGGEGRQLAPSAMAIPLASTHSAISSAARGLSLSKPTMKPAVTISPFSFRR